MQKANVEDKVKRIGIVVFLLLQKKILILLIFVRLI